MKPCAGLFKPKALNCAICGALKSSHQQSHRTLQPRPASQCGCGNPKSPREKQCEHCTCERMWRDDYRHGW